ncbi:MAG: glycosyltransferase family 1 protein [Patescibacteria group bacterium]
MRIGIDIRSLVEPFPSGISEYTAQVIKHLLAGDHENEYLFFYNATRPLPVHYVKGLSAQNARIVERRMPSKLFNAGQTFFSYPRIDSLLEGVDTFFEPNFLSFASFSLRCRVVVAVHDISFRYHDFFTAKGYWWHKFIRPKRMLERADSIIAVSESTRRDVIEQYGIDRERITVIPLGVDYGELSKKKAAACGRVRSKYRLPERYLLYLGTVEKRKNICGLLEAWEELCRGGKCQYGLVIAGRIAEPSLVRRYSSVQFLGYVPHGDKPPLYHGASAFVYPSYFEGFGIPVAEAMAAGLPVITSNATSLPSVAKEAALIIDPYNRSDLVQAMQSILNDEGLRTRLGAHARRLSAQYTWQSTAAQTLSLLTTNSE